MVGWRVRLPCDQWPLLPPLATAGCTTWLLPAARRAIEPHAERTSTTSAVARRVGARRRLGPGGRETPWPRCCCCCCCCWEGAGSRECSAGSVAGPGLHEPGHAAGQAAGGGFSSGTGMRSRSAPSARPTQATLPATGCKPCQPRAPGHRRGALHSVSELACASRISSSHTSGRHQEAYCTDPCSYKPPEAPLSARDHRTGLGAA